MRHRRFYKYPRPGKSLPGILKTRGLPSTIFITEIGQYHKAERILAIVV
jgi:hypothetical protein